MNSKNVFVADSFGSTDIAQLLQKFYGSDVAVYCEANHQVADKEQEKIFQLITAPAGKPTFENKTEKKGFDLFFLSARLIAEGTLVPKELKEKYGNPHSKVIALSVSPAYLSDVEKGFGVDHCHLKSELDELVNLTDPLKKAKTFPMLYLNNEMQDFKKEIERLMQGENKFVIYLEKSTTPVFQGAKAQSVGEKKEFEIHPKADKIFFSGEKDNAKVTYERVYSDFPSSVSTFMLSQIKGVEEILPN